jgi:hypothetical protein
MRKHSKQLESHRVLTELRLSELLLRSKSTVTLEDIQTLIFDETGKLTLYLPQLLAFFDSGADGTDIDTLLPVIQDAWNYFPHRSLNGRSPAEVLAELA